MRRDRRLIESGEDRVRLPSERGGRSQRGFRREKERESKREKGK